MPTMTLLAFLFLAASFLSLWIRREPKVWGSLLGLSLLSGLAAGNIAWVGLIFIIVLLLLWILYDQKPNAAIFILLICFSAALKMRLLPGYTPFFFTPKFAVGLEGSLIGLFPLAFLGSLSRTTKDWMAVMKETLIGCAGIATFALKLLHCSAVKPVLDFFLLLPQRCASCLPSKDDDDRNEYLPLLWKSKLWHPFFCRKLQLGGVQ